MEYELAIKKEWSADSYLNIDEHWKNYGKWQKASHKRPHFMMFHLYSVSLVLKSIETKTD